MIGSIIGDFVGSFYEGKGIKGYSLDLITSGSTFTDETVLIGATAELLTHRDLDSLTSRDFASAYKSYGQTYPDCGFGPDFEYWLHSDSLDPYGSSGAGSSSRVMPIGFMPISESRLMKLAEKSSSATHDSPDAIRCSQAVVFAIHHCLQGVSPDEIMKAIESTFFLPMTFDWEALHQEYGFSSYCENIVPEAIYVGLKARSFEDALRKGLYIGGDTDTILSIAGSVAEARGLLPSGPMMFRVNQYLEKRLPKIHSTLQKFNASIGRDY